LQKGLFIISRKETMLFYDKIMHFRFTLSRWESRKHKHSKSPVERYRKLFAWTLFAIIIATVIFSPPPVERNHLSEFVEILCYLLVAVATMGRLWCGIYVFGRKSDELCLDGPYSICRNPLYLFSFIGGMGVVMASNHILLMIVFVAISCFYYFMVVKSEEKRLLRLFGHEYEIYCSKVMRFRPNFRNHWSREKLEVNPKLIFHAMVKNMWFFWLLFTLEIIETLKRIPS
jgi:protein-S-isoprenylcysteine O-methyltransferase Ste14